MNPPRYSKDRTWVVYDGVVLSTDFSRITVRIWKGRIVRVPLVYFEQFEKGAPRSIRRSHAEGCDVVGKEVELRVDYRNAASMWIAEVGGFEE
jgi:hypothetical protein